MWLPQAGLHQGEKVVGEHCVSVLLYQQHSSCIFYSQEFNEKKMFKLDIKYSLPAFLPNKKIWYVKCTSEQTKINDDWRQWDQDSIAMGVSISH